MRKPDELAFEKALRALRPRPTRGCVLVEDVAAGIGMHPKRAYGLLEKWERQGKWESGVSTRTGWFTEREESHAEARA